VSVNLSLPQALAGNSETESVNEISEKLENAMSLQRKTDRALSGALVLMIALAILHKLTGPLGVLLPITAILGLGILWATYWAWLAANLELKQKFRDRYAGDGFSPRNIRKLYYRRYPLHFLLHLFSRPSPFLDDQWRA
jgi:hypothetical protein